MKLKRISYLFIIFMLTLTTVFSSMPLTLVKADPNFNNVVIFEENFNDHTTDQIPNNLDVSEEGGTVTIAETPDVVNKSVYLEDTSETDDVQVSRSFEELTNQVTIEMKFMQPSYTSSTKIMRLKGDGTSVILETKDGFIAYRNSDDSYENLVEVEEGQWYNIKAEVNLEEKTVNIYIDGELKIEGANLYEDASQINFFESFTPGSKALGHYLDDIRISHMEEVEVETPPVGTTVFETDFNEEVVDEVPSSVTVSEGGGTVRVKEVPSSENKSVFLNDTSDDTNVILSKNFEDVEGVVTAEMKFMQPSYTSSTKVMRVKGDATPVIIETKDNHITYRTGDHYEPLIELEEERWYQIKVEIDLDQQSANVYIDDELKLEEAALIQSGTKVNFIESFTPNSGMKGHYLDDIKITGQLPEDEPTDPVEPPTEPVEDGTGVIYEAENAEISDAIIDNQHAGFTGNGFVDYKPNAPGGWVEWIVDVPVDGEYTLDFRYAHGGTDLRPAEILVNDEVIEELPFDPTGGWATWEYTSTKVTLTKGENVIRATGVGPSGGANIDHLKVYIEFDQIFEAEEAELEPETVIIDNKHAGFTGTGFIDYAPNAPGSWVEWTVDVPVEGTYTLDFRYGHGGTDERPAEIKVNDDVVEAELEFNPTGDWAGWQYTTMTAELQTGENKIRATGVGPSGGANIDHLRVHNTSSSDDQGPIDVEETEVEEVAGGVLLKKMKELGIVVDTLPDEEESISRLAFFALVNQALGIVHEEEFKVSSNSEDIWETSSAEWYTYVLETTKELGYADDLVENGNIYPEESITWNEAIQVMKEVTGEQYERSSELALTWGEAKELITTVDSEQDSVDIAGAHAISNNVLVVTLNGTFNEFSYSDLDVVVPTRKLELLSPGFQNLRIDKAAKATNRFGQTVIVMHSQDQWNEYAEYPLETEETRFSGDLDTAIEEADNLLTWQMEHGGWTKNWSHIYTRPWDGEESRSEWVEDGEELGTIDNDATISELLYIAQVYQETKEPKYKDSVEKGLEFLFDLQYDTGGFAQVYPRRGNYSDYVTFNDEAMINVLELMELVAEQRYPFNDDLISEADVIKTKASIDHAVDYILEAQIEVDGELTAWCAQHDPYTYEPRGARSYEHPSISGQESVGIIRYLMTQPQTEEIEQAVLAGLEWLDEVKLEGIRYVSGDPNNEYFVEDENSTAWYRFYEIGTNKPIFSGRDGVIKHDIMEIEEERRNGYSWGGHWATQLLEIAQTTGNYEDKVFVRVIGNESVDVNGKTLTEDQVKVLEGQTKQMEQIESNIIVAKDGSGDYETVQAAINAVPDNNKHPVTILIKEGTYKEVVTVPANKPFITLIGEDETTTVITYDNYAGRDNGVGGTLGTSGSASVYLRADDLKIENLTLENSFDESMDVEGKQAVAVYASGDRQYFKNIRFIGNQDTLYTHSGTQYYRDVYIEGDVDFIFGGASIVVEDSIIHSLDRGSDSNNGYITAASTLLSEQYGMLIKDSTFTSDASDGTVYLGRPWPAGGNPNARGSVVIMESELGAHIKEEGWTSMSGLQPEEARLYEYENEGPGAVINASRLQLSDEEAADWTVQNVLKGWDPYTIDPDEEEPDEGEESEDENPGENPEEEPEEPGEETPDQDKEEEQDEEDKDTEKPTPNGDKQEVSIDKKVKVSANMEINIKNSNSKVILPEDLPEGTTLIIKKANPVNLDGLIVAGDVYTFDFTFPQGYEDYTGEYQLILSYNQADFNPEDVAIYYYNEATNSWERMDGEVKDGVITTTVNHFSTYGVLAEKQMEEGTEQQQLNEDNTKLPDTSTNIFNWLLSSVILILLGSLIWYTVNRRNKKVF
ncbi:pectate lyase [Gracilibacillus kekensis]|uniref:Pectate lyase, PelA/Pel-15E family n=1 Tax=Gracilibacillus kekensis TaxID=1027249 RepID=A0A1M7JHP1_9BACI|nr:pectate lyase [Gracilibacillus kekensis]SHM52466.1 pectate lyase, PelA/Pel-15E family [Gracilibacillus kekensis]